MRLFVILLVFCLLLAADVQSSTLSRQGSLALKVQTLDQKAFPACGLVEFTLDLAATYQNPFDPEQVEVWADLISPDGKILRVNGFLDQPHTRRLEGGSERITAVGDPVWRVRFASGQPGRWQYRVSARDRSGTVHEPTAAFEIMTSSHPGYLRRSATNPRGLVFDNGQPYFAVGENVCWGGKRGSFDYDDWLPALAKAGGNWMRIWMCSWNCALEWAKESRGDWRNGTYHGVGIYSLDNAWKLDQILDTAASNGISVMLCLGTYGEFNDGGYFGEGQWKANPYNVTNGGPCAKPAEFWTNEQARKLYRQRLRYVAARYGWRANIHSWEFWNEAKPPAPWVAEMAQYLKGTGPWAGKPADSFGHLVTTTYGTPEIWAIPEVDITQSHHYGVGEIPDHAPVIHDDALAHQRYGKPHLMGEFGIDWRSPDNKYDPSGKGINLHNGLWASMMSGNSGGGMLWWWDSYVHPKNLYFHFKPFRKFADQVSWAAGPWNSLAVRSPSEQKAMKEGEGLVLPANSGWGRLSGSEFEIDSKGVKQRRKLPEFLYGPAKPEERVHPVFKVQFDRAGRFVFRVNTVSDRAKIRVTADGQIVNEFSLSAHPPADPAARPEYGSTELNKQWNIHQAQFNKEYGIDLPSGYHQVRLEVTEGDWVSLHNYRLTGFSRVENPAPVNLYGIRCGREAILWCQNAGHHWKSVQEGKVPMSLGRVRLDVADIPPGSYDVEWWDTWQGEVITTDKITSTSAGMTLTTPELAKDLAARIRPTHAR
jgi:hypothetical protein